MSYVELAHDISDTRQNLRAAQRNLASELGRCIDNAQRTVRLPDALTRLVEDLAELDPKASSMSTPEYAYSLLIVYHPDLIEQRYIGIDVDEHERVVFVIQPVR